MKELKALTASLDKSLEKTKLKPKLPGSPTDAGLKGIFSVLTPIIAKEKELEAAQKQIKAYQKEISALKAKMEAKAGYEK